MRVPFLMLDNIASFIYEVVIGIVAITIMTCACLTAVAVAALICDQISIIHQLAAL